MSWIQLNHRFTAIQDDARRRRAAPVNVAPVAVDDAYSTDEDVTLSVAAAGVLANDTDAEGSPLTAILVADVSNGTLVLNADGSFSYTPDASFAGVDSFTYKANDGALNSSTATVTITVNAPPAAATLEFLPNTTLSGNIWPDSLSGHYDASTVSLVAPTVAVAALDGYDGVLTAADSTLQSSYTPSSDAFTVLVVAKADIEPAGFAGLISTVDIALGKGFIIGGAAGTLFWYYNGVNSASTMDLSTDGFHIYGWQVAADGNMKIVYDSITDIGVVSTVDHPAYPLTMGDADPSHSVGYTTFGWPGTRMQVFFEDGDTTNLASKVAELKAKFPSLPA